MRSKHCIYRWGTEEREVMSDGTVVIRNMPIEDKGEEDDEEKKFLVSISLNGDVEGVLKKLKEEEEREESRVQVRVDRTEQKTFVCINNEGLEGHFDFGVEYLGWEHTVVLRRIVNKLGKEELVRTTRFVETEDWEALGRKIHELRKLQDV